MPSPPSWISSSTYSPRARPSPAGTWAGSRATLRASTVRRPPSGMASRAFTARLTSTCSNWPGSIRTAPRPGSSVTVSCTSAPSSLPSRFSRERMRGGRSTPRGCAICRRAKPGGGAGGPRGPPRRPLDLLQVGLGPEAGGEIGAGGAEVAEDRGEDVVEVVGHPAGETADRFHLPGLEQVVLEPEPGGDVPVDGVGAVASFGDAHREAKHRDRDLAAVPVAPHRLLAHLVAAEHPLRETPPLAPALLGHDQVVEVAAPDFLEAVAEQPGELAVHPDDVSPLVGDRDRLGGALEEPVEVGLALPQLPDGAVGFAEIAHEAAEGPGPPALDDGDGELDRELGPVPANSGELDPPAEHAGLAGREEPGEPARVGGPVHRRGDRLRPGAAQHLVLAPAEDRFRLPAPPGDAPRRIHADHRVERRVENGAEPALVLRRAAHRPGPASQHPAEAEGGERDGRKNEGALRQARSPGGGMKRLGWRRTVRKIETRRGDVKRRGRAQTCPRRSSRRCRRSPSVLDLNAL